MPVEIDLSKGRAAAELFYEAFCTGGIPGRTAMPEDLAPSGVRCGSLEHLLFITLTVSVDYLRDAPSLWDSSRRTFEDPGTRYLFEPRGLAETPAARVRTDLRRHGVAKRPNQDPFIWTTVGVTFHKKWHGDPLRFLEDCGWHAPQVLARLKNDVHHQRGRDVPDYPFLRGPKIGPLWLRMLRDNVKLSGLRNLDQVPIPVDIHIARATLCLGLVRGQFDGSLEELFRTIRRAWFESVKGLPARGYQMIALDVDGPLWRLSKYGCTKRDEVTGQCPAKETCVARGMCLGGRLSLKNRRGKMDT